MNNNMIGDNIMLTAEQIEKNRIDFIEAIRLINRDFDKDGFIDWLCDETDFFTAPASTKYHSNYSGGLCQHSLNVWRTLIDLNNIMNTNLDVNSIAIVALCHDLAKVNYYVKGFKNVKEYSENGSKSDSLGKFDWISVSCFEKRKDKLIYGSHEVNSEMLAHNFIPLTIDESIAILHHHGGRGYDSAQDDIGEIFGYSTLSCLLHLADMLCAYVVEKSE